MISLKVNTSVVNVPYCITGIFVFKNKQSKNRNSKHVHGRRKGAAYILSFILHLLGVQRIKQFNHLKVNNILNNNKM